MTPEYRKKLKDMAKMNVNLASITTRQLARGVLTLLDEQNTEKDKIPVAEPLSWLERLLSFGKAWQESKFKVYSISMRAVYQMMNGGRVKIIPTWPADAELIQIWMAGNWVLNMTFAHESFPPTTREGEILIPEPVTVVFEASPYSD